ncbi:MAG: flagellar biosynthetic protein FliO [Lachnospiraceae bacterium]|nr:flagellar biosynthetic protein FliO [Lachnospiraceae bacterium]
MLLALNNSSQGSFIQLLTVIVLFIIVLALCAFTTKFVAGFQKNKMLSGNIKVLETYRITNNKYIQIIKIGDKIFAVGIGKDSVNMLCELNEDTIIFDENASSGSFDFKTILDKAKNFNDKK